MFVQLSDDDDEDEEDGKERSGRGLGRGFDTDMLGMEGQGFLWKCGDEGMSNHSTP